MARKFAAYIVVRGRKPGIYREWADCDEQVTGVSGSCYRGCKTVEEAQRTFHQLEVEGAVRVIADPEDFEEFGGPDDNTHSTFNDVPVTPSAAARGARSARESTQHGRSTPASSASRARDAPARERAPPASASRSSTRGAQAYSEGLGARRARGTDERPRRHESSPPRAEMRRDHTRTERARTEHIRTDGAGPRGTARSDGGSQDTPGTPRATRHRPVSVHTDSEDDAPPPSVARSAGRRPVRSRRIVQDTASTDTSETHYDTVPQTPAWDESASNPPPWRSVPLTRSSTHTTSQYETAPLADDPQQDLPARSSRSSSGASTSSSPPTSVSQYEDPQGRFSFHEHRRAEIDEQEAAREKQKAAQEAERNREESQTEIIEIEDDDDEVLLPRANEACTHTPSTPARSATSHRSRTEASTGAARTRSPPTPTPQRLAKSRTVPTPTTEAPFSFTYRVCRGCGQPAPNPPLFGPEDAGAHCTRCLQPVARASGHTSPRPLRKSATHDGTYVSRRRVPPSDTSSLGEEAAGAKAGPSEGARPKPDEGEDVFGLCGLSSALPRPTVIYPGERDPRSPMNGPASLPVSTVISRHVGQDRPLGHLPYMAVWRPIPTLQGISCMMSTNPWLRGANHCRS
ncbi:hypothetical protein PsYK624_084370 [Phanerochaete sordida]|uniref:Ribonuclease H1 N-terminal domain-containing protein n=1 Tax=Phanerochaete sordida TaxID=48140 RepID=A0A9P3GA83_9APHY|nr:hypothetical protein PsYK624_084370 [Phanerochaete sordida]